MKIKKNNKIEITDYCNFMTTSNSICWYSYKGCVLYKHAKILILQLHISIAFMTS